jgi:hypothetical protein
MGRRWRVSKYKKVEGRDRRPDGVTPVAGGILAGFAERLTQMGVGQCPDDAQNR